MKLIGFRNKIAGTLFALSLLFGFSLATSVTAEAQYRNDRYQGNRDRDYRDQRRRDRDNDWRNNN